MMILGAVHKLRNRDGGVICQGKPPVMCLYVCPYGILAFSVQKIPQIHKNHLNLYKLYLFGILRTRAVQ